ncbi:MAG: HEAT repeat domain-containing protein [Deltaproteobacteria bacterium]|nr:HEAT repeat domain-containing protein [Deltaproteobacteria bacterium]
MAVAKKQPELLEDGKENPLAKPENQKKLQLTTEFIQHLQRAIKSIGLYRHATGKYMEFIEKPHQALSQIVDQLGAVSFKVETQAFTLFNELLWTADSGENIPYKFYKDGIRALIFRPGITAEELLKFTLISISDTRKGDEDILSQMWTASFEHIEYILVEGFSIGEMSEEEVQIEVDKVVSYLFSRLRSNSEDYLRFARLAAEDLDIKLDNVEQLRGAVIAGETSTDELKRRVKDELREDQLKLFNKLITVLFQTMEAGGHGILEEMRDTFASVLDALLLQEDFASINQILVKLKALERNSQLASAAQALRDYFIAKMGESQRLDRIGDVLKAGKPKNAPDIFRYLMTLDSNTILSLLEILDGIELPDNRVLICDALAALGKDNPEPFVARLNSEKSQTVHDMLYIIDKCDYPDKLKIFAAALKNRNLAVRLEALNVITRAKTEGARKLVVEALSDDAPQVRVGAARALSKYDREKAVAEILRVIKSAEFEKRDQKEQIAVYAALGATDAPGAIGYFKQILEQKASLFNKKKVNEEKLLAVNGLGQSTSLVAFKLLQIAEADKTADQDLLTATRKAMFNVKKALTGDPNNQG